MTGPVTIHHDEERIRKKLRVKDCPDGCNYPIRGLPWDVVHHPDYLMTLQEEAFFGNHLQVVEMQATDEISLRFTIDMPSVFMVVMMEGFVKFHKEDLLISYAMGGVMYMTYNPHTDFYLRTSAGKHAMMVVSIEESWLLAAERTFPDLGALVMSKKSESEEPVVLPMCRLAQPVADLWDDMRVIRSNPVMRKAELATSTARLMDFYHGQLQEGNWLKGQLSVEIANRIVMYVEANYTSEKGISVARLAEHVGISEYKMGEYAELLFGKPLHRHVRDLRVAKAIKLLTQTSLSVSDIAVSVGYSNVPHFYIVFQQYFGTSPQLYRKNETERS